jgi:hypothetical protein
VVVGGTTLDPLRILHGSRPQGFTARRWLGAAAGAEVDDGPVLLFDADGDGKKTCW